MTALAHPVYIARADHADSEPLMATSLTVGMTDSCTTGCARSTADASTSVRRAGAGHDGADAGRRRRDRLRGRARGRPSTSATTTATVKNMIAARERIREVLASAGVERRRAGTVPRADARIVGPLRRFGEDARQPRVRRARPLEPHVRRAERRRRRPQLLPDRSREEPDAHRDGLGGTRRRPFGRRPADGRLDC